MKKYKVTLGEEEREELNRIVTKGNHKSQKVMNALILLNCDEGRYQNQTMRNEDVAAALRISMRKIDRVKKRFIEEGFETSLSGKKPDRIYEKKADGNFEAHLVALSCSKPPRGFARWSLRLLADRAVELKYIDAVSYETIRRVLKKRNKTRRKRGWVIPPDHNADFVAAMENVLDIYKRPYNPDFPVVCMDETPRQLIRETRKPIGGMRGCSARYDFEYERSGVYTIFMANEPLAGKRLTKTTERRTKID
jgi:hypothetical protein